MMARLLSRRALALPAMLAIGLILISALFIVAYISILQRGTYGGVVWNSYTLDAYVQFIFERDFSDNLVINVDYLRIFFRSFTLAAFTAALTLLVGFPTALWMAMQRPEVRTLLLFAITVPFWTNILIRTYSWMLILKNDGILDWFLMNAGITSRPLDLLYSPYATSIGLVYSFLPFMILPIYVSLEKIDRRYIEAAYDLGANPFRVLKRVVIPLAMPGIVAGLILVFIPCLGAFVTPDLLGGGKSTMIGNLIQQQFGAGQNWPFGAALALVLLVLVLLALMVHALRFNRRAVTP